MHITVRAATANDAGAIVRLIREHAAYDGAESPITEAYIPRYLASPAGRILLADVEGSTVGLLSYSEREDLFHARRVALIEELIVSAEWRGRGVGTALLNEFIRWSTGRGCAEVAVAVASGNARAIDFYRSNGLSEESLLLECHAAE